VHTGSVTPTRKISDSFVDIGSVITYRSASDFWECNFVNEHIKMSRKYINYSFSELKIKPSKTPAEVCSKLS
jgi:hypothetical protein